MIILTTNLASIELNLGASKFKNFINTLEGFYEEHHVSPCDWSVHDSRWWTHYRHDRETNTRTYRQWSKSWTKERDWLSGNGSTLMLHILAWRSSLSTRRRSFAANWQPAAPGWGYAVFGKVSLAGMDVVNKIALAPSDYSLGTRRCTLRGYRDLESHYQRLNMIWLMAELYNWRAL